MKKQIFNNWILKLVSVVCAMLLWLIVYNSEDPVEFERFYNVPVTFENIDILEKEGKVYEVLGGTDVINSIRVKAKRSVMNELTKDNIHVIADFNKMKLDGTIELEISCDKYASGEIDFEPSSEELQLFVESKVSASPNIQMEIVGEPAEGYVVFSRNASQNRISVSGGASKVSRIAKAVAKVDVTGATGDIITTVDLVLYDKDGAEIVSDQLEMNVKSVTTTVNIYPTKKVSVVYEISGEPAEGFVTTGEVTYGRTEIEIMGSHSNLSRVSEIVVKGEDISIEGAVENVVLDVDLDDYLSSGIYRVDRATNDGRTTVDVEIVPIIEQEFTLLAKQVTLMNIPADHFADRTLDTAEFTVTIRGAQHLLEELDSTKIRGTIDISKWMAANDLEQLGVGTVYKIVPEFDLDEAFEVTDSEAIEVAAGIVEEE